MGVLHEITAYYVVAIGDTLGLLRTRGEKQTRILDTPECEHVSAGMHVEPRAFQSGAGKVLDRSSLRIQTDVSNVGEGDHANVFRLSQHRTIDAGKTGNSAGRWLTRPATAASLSRPHELPPAIQTRRSPASRTRGGTTAQHRSI